MGRPPPSFGQVPTSSPHANANTPVLSTAPHSGISTPFNDLQTAIPPVLSAPTFGDLQSLAADYAPSPARRLPEVVQRLVDLKHRQYNRRAYFSRLTYYATRTVAGLAAGLLPFVVRSSPTLAIALSVSIVVAIVIDSVYKPGDKWRTYSRASDLLLITQLQAEGLYEQAKEILNVIQATEAEAVSQLVDLEQVLQKVKKAGS